MKTILLLLLSVSTALGQPWSFHDQSFLTQLIQGGAPLPSISSDVVVYGGTSGGTMAAISAARLGKSVSLISENTLIGGMTSGGLQAIDVGSLGDGYIKGLAQEFYTRCSTNYEVPSSLQPYVENPEPKVAEHIFREMIAASIGNGGSITVYTNQVITLISMVGSIISTISTSATNYSGKVFIDASYTADMMKMSGVSSTIGRESTNQYSESLNGVQPSTMIAGIDPFITAGNSNSGLLQLVFTNQPSAVGSADSLVQAYNFRMCWTSAKANQTAFYAPTNYQSTNYALVARYLNSLASPSLSSMFYIQGEQNSKFDINNQDPISTDYVGWSKAYLTNTPVNRGALFAAYRDYILGLVYFLANDASVTNTVRNAMTNYGYAKDEWVATSNFPPVLYVREGYRNVSDHIMTQANVLGTNVPTDGVGLIAYGADRHEVQRYVLGTNVYYEGGIIGALNPPYPFSLPYSSMVPKTNECSNLINAWGISASSVAFAPFRMEPSFMISGHAAGTAAYLSIASNCAVQNISVSNLQSIITANGGLVAWPKTNGPIAQYRFTEGSGSTTADSAGNNTGTLIASPVWTNAVFANGLYFNTTNYVIIGTNRMLTESPMTWSSWVILTNNTVSQSIMGGTNSGHIQWRFQNDGTMRVLDQGVGHVVPNSSGNVATNVLTQVGFTWDGLHVTFYTNGIAAGPSGSLTGTFTPGMTTIGNAAGVSQPLQGYLFDVQVWPRAITGVEMLGIFTNGVK